MVLILSKRHKIPETKPGETTNETKQKLKHTFLQGLHNQIGSSTPIYNTSTETVSLASGRPAPGLCPDAAPARKPVVIESK